MRRVIYVLLSLFVLVIFLAALAFFFFAMPINNYADHIRGELGIYGGAPRCVFSSKGIRLDSQKVTIRLKQESYIVDGVYRFFNPGEELRKWIAFPKRYYIGYPSQKQAKDFISFQVFVNGQKTQFTEKHGIFMNTLLFLTGLFDRFPLLYGDYDKRLAQLIIFKGNALTIIHSTFKTQYTASAYHSKVGTYLVRPSLTSDAISGESVFVVDATHARGSTHYYVNFPVTLRRPTTEPLSFRFHGSKEIPSVLTFGFSFSYGI